MAAQSPGATLRLGRVVNGGLSVGDALRDLRLQPVVRLGVTYNSEGLAFSAARRRRRLAAATVPGTCVGDTVTVCHRPRSRANR